MTSIYAEQSAVRDIGHDFLNAGFQQSLTSSVVEETQGLISNIESPHKKSPFSKVKKTMAAAVHKLPPASPFTKSGAPQADLSISCAVPVFESCLQLPETKIDFWGRRLFKRQGDWWSLNGEAKRVIKLAEDEFFVHSLTSRERVSRLDWTQTVRLMYEKTDEQLEQKWRITRLFNRVQEVVLRVAKRRDALINRVTKLFRGYSSGLLVESFAEKRFSNFNSLFHELVDGQGTLSPSKFASSQYFVKEEVLRTRAEDFAKKYPDAFCNSPPV